MLDENHWERAFGAGETQVFVSAYLDKAAAEAAVRAATKPSDAAEYYTAAASLFAVLTRGELESVRLMVGGSWTAL